MFSRKKNYITKVRSTYALIPHYFRQIIDRQSRQRLYSLLHQVSSWFFPKVLIEIAKNSGNPPFSWWKNKNDATETLSNGPRSSFKVETRQPKWLPSILQRTTGPNSKKTAKKEFQKIREIVGLYLCMQRFHKSWMWRAGNQKRKLCKFTETCIEKTRENRFGSTFFQRFFAIWNHCAVQVPRRELQLGQPHCQPSNARPQSNFPASFRMKRKTRGKMEASDWLKAQLRHLLPLYYKLLVKLACPM